MQRRLNVVTLGVADVARSTAFYEQLGWKRSSASHDSISFLQLGPIVLGLIGRAALAEDAGLPNTPLGFGGFTLSQNVESPDAVIAVIDEALAAGARLLKPPHKAFWGGFTAYFADPDGHPWEIAHNPFFDYDEAGMVRLPD